LIVSWRYLRASRDLGNSVYTITDDGEQYLDGELDTGESDERDDESGPKVSA
jgi:hypothetical protein